MVPVAAYAAGFLNNHPTSEVLADSNNSQNMALLVSNGGFAVSTTSSPTIVDNSALAVPQNTAPMSATNDQISLYIVHQGDTLSEIANMFGVSENTIVWANNLKNKKVTPGQELVILPISGVDYTVKKGDTLLSVAKKYNGDANEIAQFNGLNDDAALSVGQSIIIPDGELTSSEAGPVSSHTTVQGSSSNGSSSESVNESGSGGYVAGLNNGVGTSPLASGALPAPDGAPRVGDKGPNYKVYVGYYLRPIVGGVKTQGIHGHNAVDLAGSYGQDIMAAADGTVIVAKTGGWNGGYGNYVVINHPNGTQTLYAHLSKVLVDVGDTVSQGQDIGYMGETGDATGVHVHFEIRGAANPF